MKDTSSNKEELRKFDEKFVNISEDRSLWEWKEGVSVGQVRHAILELLDSTLEAYREEVRGKIETRESPCLCSNLIRCDCPIRQAHEVAKKDFLSLLTDKE